MCGSYIDQRSQVCVYGNHAVHKEEVQFLTGDVHTDTRVTRLAGLLLLYHSRLPLLYSHIGGLRISVFCLRLLFRRMLQKRSFFRRLEEKHSRERLWFNTYSTVHKLKGVERFWTGDCFVHCEPLARSHGNKEVGLIGKEREQSRLSIVLRKWTHSRLKLHPSC